jgi:hypothetical protein
MVLRYEIACMEIGSAAEGGSGPSRKKAFGPPQQGL